MKNKELIKYLNLEDVPDYMLPVVRWKLQRRIEQICPKPTKYAGWMCLGGRGSGTTYAAANSVYEYCVNLIGENPRIYIGLIGSTFTDARHNMVEGPSGLLNTIPKTNVEGWNRSLGELVFSVGEKEVFCRVFSSEKPGLLRGPNHHLVWIDNYHQLIDANFPEHGSTWWNADHGLKLGLNPFVIASGIPRPCLLGHILMRRCSVSRMQTFDNASNLSKAFIHEIFKMNPNSKRYKREVLGEIIED